jgi:hypothetical protein
MSGAGTWTCPTDGTRHVIYLTFDQSNLKVYVDGTLDSTTAQPVVLSYTVSSGGTTGLNGTYTFYMYAGNNIYEKWTPYPCGLAFVSGMGWRITSYLGGTALLTYISTTDTGGAGINPPTTGWGVGTADSPAPSVTANATPATLASSTNGLLLGSNGTDSLTGKESAVLLHLSALTSGEVTTLQGMCAGVTTYIAAGTVSGDATSGILLTATCTGQTNVTTTSGGGGTYTLTGLVAGDWTITPTLAGYTFAPTTADANITSSDVTGKDFVATAVGGGGPALPILVQYYRRLRSK